MNVSNELNKSERGYLLTVTDSENSSPGRKGFKMAVFPSRRLIGSIGGGILEKNLIDELMSLLGRGQELNEFREYHHNDEKPNNKSGMICSGTQSIMINSISSDSLTIFNEIIELYNLKKQKYFCLSEKGLCIEDNEKSCLFKYTYIEKIGLPEIAYIVGGGHVGLAVSKQMKLLGFHIVVFENRKNISTLQENSYADEIVSCPAGKIGERIIEDDNSFVIIVSHNHSEDLKAMLSVVRKKVAYIGVMGSPQKTEFLMREADKLGYKKDELAKVNAPIGININSRTPEEIAVSIAAEIIRIKNK